jgi:FK506-binding protein 4/5
MADTINANQSNVEQSTAIDSWTLDISETQNKSILKRILRTGSEDLNIKDGDYGQYYLNIVFEDNPTPDRLRVSYIKFGKSDNYKKLETTLKSMRKGEIAEFLWDCSKEPIESDNVGIEDGSSESDVVRLKIEMLGLFQDDVLKGKEDGLLRFRLKESDGTSCPKDGAEITCHLAAFLLDGTKLEERDVCFTLGEGAEVGIPRGVELALQHMKLFEKSRFLFQRSLGFRPIPDRLIQKLPHNYEELVYEIRLNQFDNAKEVWELSNEDRLTSAQSFKDKGTAYFKQQKYELAVKFYSKVIYYLGPPDSESFGTDERGQVLLAGYLNLAQTYLKLDKPFDAIKNCELALQIDSTSVKARYRKGLAHMKCKEFDVAIELFKQVIESDPNNRAALKELAACTSLIKTSKAKERNTFRNMFEKFAQIDQQREQTARGQQKDIWKELQEESEFKTPDGDPFSDLPIKMI